MKFPPRAHLGSGEETPQSPRGQVEQRGPVSSTSSHPQNGQGATLLGLKLSHSATAHAFRDSWSAVPRGTADLRGEAAHAPPGYRPLVPAPHSPGR